MSYEFEEHLDDNVEVEFSGAKLALTADKDQYGNVASKSEGERTTFKSNSNVNEMTDNFNSANSASNTNSRSVIHLQSPEVPTPEGARSYFAIRDGAFENAVENCRPVLIKTFDGELCGAWFLTEIDHWDKEKERIILLTDHTIIIIKYDLIALRLLEYKRIFLRDLDRIVIGELKYPQGSLIPTRNVPGMRIMWNKGRPLSFTQSWNPFSQDIPWVTFTSHPLAWHKNRESSTYKVETFSKDFLQAINKEKETVELGVIIENKPILIENYIGIASAFFNANNLGFFKNRGRLSF